MTKGPTHLSASLFDSWLILRFLASSHTVMTPSDYISMSSAPDSETHVSPSHLRSAPSQPRILCSTPPSWTPSHRPLDPLDFHSGASPPCPFVLLAIGRGPLTHKGHY